MIYTTKQDKNKINKFKEINIDDEIAKKFSIYSTGGKIERSFKQRVGKKANKNWDKKLSTYNLANEVLKKIEDRTTES